jgi:hypothetical protein
MTDENNCYGRGSVEAAQHEAAVFDLVSVHRDGLTVGALDKVASGLAWLVSEPCRRLNCRSPVQPELGLL